MNEWREHCVSHLPSRFTPKRFTCKKCGFKSRLFNDGLSAWQVRREHIAHHSSKTYLSAASMGPNPDLVSYAWAKGLISNSEYRKPLTLADSASNQYSVLSNATDGVSTTSSTRSSQNATAQQSLLNHVVESVMRNEKVSQLCEDARSLIARYRLERNVGSLLQVLARELQNEADDKSKTQAAIYLGGTAHLLSVSIADQVYTHDTISSSLQSTPRVFFDDVKLPDGFNHQYVPLYGEEAIGSCELTHDDLLRFVTCSAAFDSFIIDLTEFVHPSCLERDARHFWLKTPLNALILAQANLIPRLIRKSNYRERQSIC